MGEQSAVLAKSFNLSCHFLAVTSIIVYFPCVGVSKYAMVKTKGKESMCKRTDGEWGYAGRRRESGWEVSPSYEISIVVYVQLVHIIIFFSKVLLLTDEIE